MLNLIKSGSTRLLTCWLLFLTGLQAQQYVFHVYRQAEGLKNIAINGMARDRDGFLWLATENGVYRFLGASFEQFGPDQGIASWMSVTSSQILKALSGWALTRIFIAGMVCGFFPLDVSPYRSSARAIWRLKIHTICW